MAPRPHAPPLVPARRGAGAALLALLLTAAGAVQAQVAVLVHGYLGDRESWQEAGIEARLGEAGWRDAGAVVPSPRGMVRAAPEPAPRTPAFYTVELPSEAPVLLQARVLDRALAPVRRAHPEAPLILVGHSAGGVVARAWMVGHPETPVRALVTVASPHLGTDRAGLGLAAGHSPLGLFAPFMGLGSLNRSQGLYADLTPERPGNLLHWLNRQPHPEAAYISVVRAGDDPVVPAASQHLGNVAALGGRARSVTTSSGHLLEGADGAVLARILDGLR